MKPDLRKCSRNEAPVRSVPQRIADAKAEGIVSGRRHHRELLNAMLWMQGVNVRKTVDYLVVTESTERSVEQVEEVVE